MNTALYNTYRFIRRPMARYGRVKWADATRALDQARRLLDYGKPATLPTDWRVKGCGVLGKRRWVENPEREGFRFVGYADEIAGLRHRGWFVDDNEDEVYRGAVYRLPHGRFVAGFPDPYNDGPAFVELETTDDEQTAARWADDLARIMAEENREWSRASSARIDHDQMGADMAVHRRGFLKLRELKRLDANGNAETYPPHVVAAIQDSIASHLRDYRKLKAERRQLRNTFAHQAGWEE